MPCRNCQAVLYCSEECEHIGWYTEGHCIECQYLASIVRAGACKLAFRVFFKGCLSPSKEESKETVITNNYQTCTSLHHFLSNESKAIDDYKKVLLYSVALTFLLKQESDTVINVTTTPLEIALHALRVKTNSYSLQHRDKGGRMS